MCAKMQKNKGAYVSSLTSAFVFHCLGSLIITYLCLTRPKSNKTFSMLTLAEPEIYPAHIFVGNCWHFNIH